MSLSTVLHLFLFAFVGAWWLGALYLESDFKPTKHHMLGPVPVLRSLLYVMFGALLMGGHLFIKEVADGRQQTQKVTR